MSIEYILDFDPRIPTLYGNRFVIMRKKALEISCYVGGAGAFGVFLRWLQDMLAFNDDWLADPSAFHVLVPVFILAAALVFRHFLKVFAKKNQVLPEDYRLAFQNESRLFKPIRWAIGLIMVAGGLLLLMTSELDKYAGLLRVLSLAAIAVGIGFPILMSAPGREKNNVNLLCLLSFLPVFLFAAWLIYDYRANAINSVIWSYVLEVFTVIAAMVAFFRIAGFFFGVSKPQKTMFGAMFAGMLCLMSLADERYMGMHVILFASALMLIFTNWVMIENLQQGEVKKEASKKDDGFDHL